jgi:hypothetical protein
MATDAIGFNELRRMIRSLRASHCSANKRDADSGLEKSDMDGHKHNGGKVTEKLRVSRCWTNAGREKWRQEKCWREAYILATTRLVLQTN